MLLQGRVIDKFKAPIAEATVWLDYGRGGPRGGRGDANRRVPDPVRTDAEGRFAFQGETFRNLRVSLQVAIISTVFVMTIGVTLGAMAGYYRGWIDTIVARLTEITMAFPVILFAVALASTAGSRLNSVTFGGLLGEGVVTLVLIFTIFGWFYPARIIRAKVFSLREKEFVEAAQMTGASDMRIIRSHLLPHLMAPIIVYSTLIVASYILFEAALSFLGVGIQLQTASWGNRPASQASAWRRISSSTCRPT